MFLNIFDKNFHFPMVKGGPPIGYALGKSPRTPKWPKWTIFEGKMKEKLQKSGGNPRKSFQDTGADSLERFTDIIGSPDGF